MSLHERHSFFIFLSCVPALLRSEVTRLSSITDVDKALVVALGPTLGTTRARSLFTLLPPDLEISTWLHVFQASSKVGRRQECEDFMMIWIAHDGGLNRSGLLGTLGTLVWLTTAVLRFKSCQGGGVDFAISPPQPQPIHIH